MWVASGAMMLCSWLSYVDRQVLAVLSPTILQATGLNAQRYGEIVSVFSIAYMIANPLWGALLDYVGLRIGMIAAVAIWSVASAAHAGMSGFLGFAACRAFLGLGEGATFPGGFRASVDSLPPDRQARGMAIAYSGGSLGAIFAPVVVVPVAAAFGWRAAFLGMAALGICAILLVTLLLPETKNRPAIGTLSLSSVVRSYGIFLRHRTYRVYLAIVAASYGGLFAWISGSSFVLQDLYGLSPLLFGLIFAMATLGYGAGTLIAANLVGRIGIDRTIVCGAVALAAGGLAMAAAVALGVTSPFALVAPMALYLCGLGLAMPQSMAGALMPFAERAGAASSLLGFLQQAVASSIGIAVGQMLGSSALPLALVIATMGCLALALALIKRSMRDQVS